MCRELKKENEQLKNQIIELSAEHLNDKASIERITAVYLTRSQKLINAQRLLEQAIIQDDIEYMQNKVELALKEIEL